MNAPDRHGSTIGELRDDGEYQLVAKPDEIVHIVCCRDVSWKTTFCGEDGTEINPAARIACTMCLDEAEAMYPGWASLKEPICPIDRNPCPDEHEVDLRIAQETRPTG